MSVPADGCTNGCTNGARALASGGGGVDAGRCDFAEALAMLVRLPLTGAERAEVIRRLLGGADRAAAGNTT